MFPEILFPLSNTRWRCWTAVHEYWKNATVPARIWKNDITYLFFFVLLLIIYWLVQRCHVAAPTVIELWQKNTHWFIPVTDARNLSGVHEIKWISPWDNEKTVRQRDTSNVKIEAWNLTCGLFTLDSQSQCCHLPHMMKKRRFASQHYGYYKIMSQKNIQQILSNTNNLQFFFQRIRQIWHVSVKARSWKKEKMRWFSKIVNVWYTK